jgi:hypothetical protein
MKITLEATATVDTIGGKIQARIWTGTTESGIPVKAWVALIQPQTHDEAVAAEFASELREVPASLELVSFDIRLVL